METTGAARERWRSAAVSLRHLWPWLTRPGSVHALDQSVMASINAASLSEHFPPGLSLKWLGVAGFVLAYQGYRLVIDPYLTRAPLRRVLASPLVADRALLRRHVPRADAILVGHTHFDHALDVAALCDMHGCPAYGSTSLQALLRLHGLDRYAHVPIPHRPLSLGPFTVSFVPSKHSPLLLGLGVPFAGEFSCEHLDQLRGHDYRCGDVFGIHVEVAGVTFYHQGSAELLEDQIRVPPVDYLLSCIAGRTFSPHFIRRSVRALDPGVIVAHHHDNFLLPVEGPMGFSFNVNCEGFLSDVHSLSASLTVRAFSPLQVVGSPAP